MNWLADALSRSYFATRHDIGRKVMALMLALLLWAALFNAVGGKADLRLPVRARQSADNVAIEAQVTPGIYLVAAEDVIIRGWQPNRIRLDVKGVKDDVDRLHPVALFQLDAAMLEGEDEKTLDLELSRDNFTFKVPDPRLTQFEPHRPTLQVTVARKEAREISLSFANVEVIGKPQEGYHFDPERIRVFPNTVMLSGPLAEIDRLSKNPNALKLAPVRVADKLGEVSQRVGLAAELLDGDVRLLTPGNVVDVTVFLEPVPDQEELPLVRVHFINKEELTRSGFSVEKATPEEVDLVVRGPRSIMNRGPNWLRSAIYLQFDWSKVSSSLRIGSQKIDVLFDEKYAELLAGKVTVADKNGQPLEVLYTLREIASDG